MAELTELTMEAYQKLAKAGRVEPVSEPLTLVLRSGETCGLIGGIELLARDYPTASKYMIGLSIRIEDDVLVTPFVLYRVSE